MLQFADTWLVRVSLEHSLGRSFVVICLQRKRYIMWIVFSSGGYKLVHPGTVRAAPPNIVYNLRLTKAASERMPSHVSQLVHHPRLLL